MSVYPHRLTKFQEQKCDVCETEISSNFITVPSVSYMGLQYCDSLKCKETAKSWLLETTISSSDLKEKYGEKIKVQRSNGVMETDWSIYSDAFKEESNGPYWVKIHDASHKYSKCVPLSTLTECNQKLI